MHLSPLELYQRDLQMPGFVRDQSQGVAVAHLQDLYERLLDQQSPSVFEGVKKYVFHTVFGQARIPVKGLYFWGGVGRGKTYLMDTFFDALPFDEKLRTHFHRFMRSIHKEMKTLKGQANPLEIVADRIAQQYQVICFDEFFVADITDAMILGTLLKALFNRGVSLVATSNVEPNGLYRDGLQRARFIPAIVLLEQHTTVVNVDGGVDYRLRALEQAELYHCPADEKSHTALGQFFRSIIRDGSETRTNIPIEVEGRAIAATKEAEDVVWFEFAALCDGPRSQNDYIELAREYHAVIVENVPVFTGENDDQARRFIYLVDEFYDRHVKLILSADAPIRELYQAGRLGFEFERTMSRVLEMQSTEFLARAHRA